MKLLVNINGPMAIGKSTLTTLIWRELKNWPFVDRPMIKRGLKPAPNNIHKKLSKKATFELIKYLMKEENVNGILVAEMNAEHIVRDIGKEMKEADYELLSFRLVCSVEEAERREIERQKNRGKDTHARLEHLRRIHAEQTPPYDFEVIVDTEKMSIKESFEFMMNEIKKKSQ